MTALPELHQTLLDDDTLRQLGSDLQQCAEILELKSRSTPRQREAQPIASIAEGLEALLQRRIQGVQIRYLHEGEHWLDTLLVVPNGTRLTRINLASVQSDQD